MNKIKSFIPIIFTVGQVIIFPYYIIWLKAAALTYTVFALLFAIHSFTAAFGYVLYKKFPIQNISWLLLGNGLLYIAVGYFADVMATTFYYVLFLQICLGFMQGYFKAWHVQQNRYHLDAVQHYIVVGIVMVGIALLGIVSPGVLLMGFGVLLVILGFFHK